MAVGDSLTDPRTGYTLPRQVWLRRVGRQGYKTFNLGVSGETTGDMYRRIDQTLLKGQPQIVVIFGGANDAFRGVDPVETERNVTFIVDWLCDHGIRQVVLISPGPPHSEQDVERAEAIEEVRRVLGDIAQRYGAIFVDLARFLRARIERGVDPNFAREPYRQSRSWYVAAGDPHFNAYGQRLIAEAFVAAVADWQPAE
ncbi:MAG: SGNH/GDSL hydrolase family protein [Solirubrobacteraceae bacterium]